MTFLTYRSNRQSIREKEIEYAKKGKDTTIDSLNEAKEILSELNEEIKGSFIAFVIVSPDILFPSLEIITAMAHPEGILT